MNHKLPRVFISYRREGAAAWANSFVGLATRFAAASIDWSVVAVFLAGGVAGNTAAAILVPRLDQRRLKRIFAIFILLVGLFTAASATGVIPIRIK